MSEVLDRSGLAAGLESAGIAWRELNDAERVAYAVDGVEPEAICWPASYEQAAQALQVADRLGLAVSSRGSGTKLGLGNPPRAADLIVSTEKLNRIVEYAPANLTLTVEAGLRLGDLNRALAEHGQFLPLDPPWADQATLGGIIAANSSGPLRLGYGSPRDLVIGTKAATTTGTVVKAGGRVVKNVAGYDLNKLYVGSLGTLALIVEIGFKLAPLPTAQTTVIGRFRRLDQLGEAARLVARSALLPTALDLLNAPAARSLSLATPVIGADPGEGYLLAAQGTAPGGAVARQRDGLATIFRDAGADAVSDLTDAASAEFWKLAAERRVRPLGPNLVQVKLAAPLGQGPAVVQALEEIRLLGAPPTVGGQAGSGVFYAGWSLGEELEVDRLAEVAGALQRLRESARSGGGSLVIEACPRPLKDQIDVWGEVGAALPLMRRLKAALDPNNTLNPGRFVGGI